MSITSIIFTRRFGILVLISDISSNLIWGVHVFPFIRNAINYGLMSENLRLPPSNFINVYPALYALLNFISISPIAAKFIGFL
jgi:hypothetical protein